MNEPDSNPVFEDEVSTADIQEGPENEAGPNPSSDKIPNPQTTQTSLETDKKKKKKKKKKKNSHKEINDDVENDSVNSKNNSAATEADDVMETTDCEVGLRNNSCGGSAEILTSKNPVGENEVSLQMELEQAEAQQPCLENTEVQNVIDSSNSEHLGEDTQFSDSPDAVSEFEKGSEIVGASEKDPQICSNTDTGESDSFNKDSVDSESDAVVNNLDNNTGSGQEIIESDGQGNNSEHLEENNCECDNSLPKINEQIPDNGSEKCENSNSAESFNETHQIVCDNGTQNSHSEESSPPHNSGPIHSSETCDSNSTDNKLISNSDINNGEEESKLCENSQNVDILPCDTKADSNSHQSNQLTQDVAGDSPQSENSNDMDGESYQRKLADALTIHDEEEDELMTQIDSELVSSSPPNINESTKPNTTSKDKKTADILNGMHSSDLQFNRELLEQLQIRDAEIKRLTAENKADKEKISLLSSDDSSNVNADDVYLPQIKELEKTISELQNEVKLGKDKLVSHDQAAKRAVTSLQNELKGRVDQVTKQYEDTRHEKDMMVIRFAEAEAKTLEAQQKVVKWEKKVKDVLREKENMVAAVKAAKADREKALANQDAKVAEVKNLNKELEKQKEAVSSADYRIKWFQNKLKDELENHKVTKEALEKTNSKLKEAREETEMIRQDCQAIVKRYQESEEIKSNSLDKELKIKESELMLQKQERTDTEEIHAMTKRELDSLKSQHKDTLEEVKVLQDKVTCLEEERQQNHQMIEGYQEIMQRQKSENTEMRAKVATTTDLEEELTRAKEMLSTLDKEMLELKTTKRDLQKDMDQYLERESKMLNLQSELSRSNALLRSENSSLSNKTSTLSAEVEKMKAEIKDHEAKVKDLSNKYEKEKISRKEEFDKINAMLTEHTKESNDYRQKWEDEVDNTKTLKRRHANNIKDLTRQLQQVRRRLEAMEGKEGSMGSRTNSNVSLNSIDNTGTQANTAAAQPVIQEHPVITEQVEVDKQVLIERIVRLQKSHARKNEKLEFLGEHIQQLLDEIRRKNKVIQSYVVREDAGTLSSDMMDANKAQAQSEIQSLLAGKGGIMASMYSQHQQDGHMTLELSLQINGKLQAVLEDTLLKNITLKENFDTLGEEIARLSQENRKLQLSLREMENPGSTS